MAGSYCYDLTIERADILSLIHHCFGPAMLIWIRTYFSSHTSDDATMVRLLISFVFFGAAMGGTLTTTILVLLKLFRSQLAPYTIHRAVSSLVWILSINTLLATTFGSAYMAYWEDNLLGIWGYWCLIPMALSAFEYYLQWRWAVKFQLIADKLAVQTQTMEKFPLLDKKGQSKKGGIVDMLRNKYTFIRFVIGCRLVSYSSLYLHVASLALKEYDFIETTLKEVLFLA
jgi:hypothetical protein